MNGLPYYKAYPRDFIEGTIGMPFELKCAYRVVLDLIYMQGGNLPDDARYISGLLGCTVRKWNALRTVLVRMGKLHVNGAFLTNYRADKELETLRKLGEKQAENRSRPNKIKAVQSPKPHHTEPEPEPSVTSVTEKKARKRAERLPEDWILPSEWIEDATSRGLTVEQAHDQAERMRDWSRSAPASKGAKLDWRAAWRNWIKRVCDDRAAAPRGGGGGNYADRQRAAADVAQSAAVRVAQRRMGWGDDDTHASPASDDGSHLRVVTPGESGSGFGADRALGPALPPPAAKRYGGGSVF